MGWTTSTRIWPTLYLLKSPISWYPANLWSFLRNCRLIVHCLGRCHTMYHVNFRVKRLGNVILEWQRAMDQRFFLKQFERHRILLDTVDGSEILDQLSLVGYPIIYRYSYIHPTDGWPWDFWTINSIIIQTQPEQVFCKSFTPLPSERRMLFWLKPDEPFIETTRWCRENLWFMGILNKWLTLIPT